MASIAIVEDETIVALDIEQMVVGFGHGSAGIYAKAEDLLSTLGQEPPDLVLSDIHLAGKLDGIELCRILREERGIPVILITAYADSETVARAALTYPFAYIVKPFTENELSAALEVTLFRADLERRLQVEERKYRALFVDGFTGHFLCTDAGELIDFNHAFARLAALPHSDATSRNHEHGSTPAEGHSGQGRYTPLASLLPDGTLVSRVLSLVHEAGDRLPNTETKLRDTTGSEHTVLLQAAVFRDTKQPGHLIHGEVIDLTEQRLLEERLVQTQKLDAVGRLATGIAHDFNNVLTIILGYADLLSGATLDAESIEEVDGIRYAALRAAAMTKQLLAFSRTQTYSPRRFDLSTLLRDTMNLLSRLLPPRITLSLRLALGSVEVIADPGHLTQAILNLVVNARDAIGSEGQIIIRCSTRSVDAPLDLGRSQILATGSYATLSVSDTGAGVPAGLEERIFEAFFTTKGEDRGTGLGLSVVDNLLRRCGGAVVIETSGTMQGSESRRGATFTLWIPRPAPGDAQSETASPGTKTSLDVWNISQAVLSSCRGLTALVVEDEREVADLVARMLERAGLKALVAANAGEALLLAESEQNAPDILITAVSLPLIDGPTLYRRLWFKLPALRCLYLVGVPDSASEIGAGMASNGYTLSLQKPFDANSFIRALAGLCQGLVRKDP